MTTRTVNMPLRKDIHTAQIQPASGRGLLSILLLIALVCVWGMVP